MPVVNLRHCREKDFYRFLWRCIILTKHLPITNLPKLRKSSLVYRHTPCFTRCCSAGSSLLALIQHLLVLPILLCKIVAVLLFRLGNVWIWISKFCRRFSVGFRFGFWLNKLIKVLWSKPQLVDCKLKRKYLRPSRLTKNNNNHTINLNKLNHFHSNDSYILNGNFEYRLHNPFYVVSVACGLYFYFIYCFWLFKISSSSSVDFTKLKFIGLSEGKLAFRCHYRYVDWQYSQKYCLSQ